MRRNEKSIRNQARHHDHPAIDRECETHITKQSSSPMPILVDIAHIMAFSVRIIEFVLVVLVFDQALMGGGIRVGDLVVEESWEDEGDGSRAGAADVGENFL